MSEDELTAAKERIEELREQVREDLAEDLGGEPEDYDATKRPASNADED